jgi:hypothetical protein
VGTRIADRSGERHERCRVGEFDAHPIEPLGDRPERGQGAAVLEHAAVLASMRVATSGPHCGRLPGPARRRPQDGAGYREATVTWASAWARGRRRVLSER